MKPTIAEMVVCLEAWKSDFQHHTVAAICGEWGVIDEEGYQAIRAALLKLEEWKKQADLILSVHRTLSEDARDDLILSIHDFWEEGEDECK